MFLIFQFRFKTFLYYVHADVIKRTLLESIVTVCHNRNKTEDITLVAYILSIISKHNIDPLHIRVPDVRKTVD